MRYLKEEPFLTHKGDVLKVAIPDGDGKVEEREATVGKLLSLILESYTPQQGRVLQIADIRKLNRVLDILEKGPSNGCYHFEDSDFQIMKQIVDWMAPLLPKAVMRSSDLLADMLDGALTSLP